MRVRIFAIAIAIVLAVLLAPATAHAKGPNAATIDGAGLTAPIPVDHGGGERGLSTLIDQTGFFSATFREQPDPMLDAAPTQDLGPMLVVSWNVPSGQTTADTIRQEVYPYAAGGPVVYTAPGQSFLQSERTRGGWYRAPAALTATLTQLGVPARAELEGAVRSAAPATRVVSDGGSTSLLPVVLVIVAAAMIASVAIVTRRRAVPA
jgi:hypothetical protein